MGDVTHRSAPSRFRADTERGVCVVCTRVKRVVQPEMLDGLPHGHPEAVRSRADLVRINRIMGNWSWIERELRARTSGGARVLELGAGDGAFGHWLARNGRKNAAPGGVVEDWHGLDLAPRPESWPEDWSWTQADLLRYDCYSSTDVVVANLVLHHFDEEQLRQLGSRMRHGPGLILACETARRLCHVWQAHALALWGMSRVTRHDAPVSVRAGFRDGELPALLGLDGAGWQVEITQTWKGAYRMVAQRR